MKDSFNANVPVVLAVRASAWSDEEVEYFFEDLLALGYDQKDLTEMSPGKFKIWPVSTPAAARLDRELAHPGVIDIHIESDFAGARSDVAAVYITLVGYKGKPILVKAGAVKRMIEEKAEREGKTFEHAMAEVMAGKPVPARVKKMRAPQVDQQDTKAKNPNPALMTQTPGVGTVTFDTSMGETMVADLKGSDDIDLSKSQLTQNARSVQVYRVAESMLEAGAVQGPVLDYGSGLGQSSQIFKGRDLAQYEPNPKPGLKKANPKISEHPSGTWPTVVNSFVLNVVPPEVRTDILGKIAALVAPGGHAIIGTRGTDVMQDVQRILNARKKDPNAYPGARIIDASTLVTSKGTYQHGFTKDELAQECEANMPGFSVVKTTGGSSYPIVVLKKG